MVSGEGRARLKRTNGVGFGQRGGRFHQRKQHRVDGQGRAASGAAGVGGRVIAVSPMAARRFLRRTSMSTMDRMRCVVLRRARNLGRLRKRFCIEAAGRAERSAQANRDQQCDYKQLAGECTKHGMRFMRSQAL